MSENFPNFIKDMIVHIQEAQKTLSMIDTKRSTSRHMIIKLLEVKDKEGTWRELGRGKRKLICHIQGSSVRKTASFS